MPLRGWEVGLRNPSLCLLIYLTPTLKPDACLSCASTQSDCPFIQKDICLAPAFWPGHVPGTENSCQETDNNPSPRNRNSTRVKRYSPSCGHWPWPHYPQPIGRPSLKLQPAAAVLFEHLPVLREGVLSELTARQPLAPRALCPSQHAPPSEMASPTPASPQCTWQC